MPNVHEILKNWLPGDDQKEERLSLLCAFVEELGLKTVEHFVLWGSARVEERRRLDVWRAAVAAGHTRKGFSEWDKVPR